MSGLPPLGGGRMPDGAPKCDHGGCDAPAARTCSCRRCASELDDGERFHACAAHLETVRLMHQRVRGRPFE